MSRTFLPVILLLHSLLVLFADGLELFPRQLHCSSTMYLTDKLDSGADTKSTSTNPIDLYQVEEYVDLDARRSTVSVIDVVKDSTKIYYNHKGPTHTSERSFILYLPQMRSCEEQSIVHWTLAPLRQIAINLHESITDDKREHVDASIGPSSLLYAIENNLSDFVFQSRILSKSKMTNVDVFAKEINYETFIGEESINIIVHVMARGRGSPKKGDTLASIDDQITGMDIALIGACKTGSRDNLESAQTESPKKANKKGKKGKASKKDDEPQQSQQHPIDIQLGEDSFCDRASLLFTVHYHIASLYKPGTLVGKSLEDFGEVTEYNFQLEPFVLPVGIGCLSTDLSSRPDWQKKLTRGRMANRFSAQYVSSYGEPGVSYVAYEFERALRLDQAGRKNIFHANSGLSYHIGEIPLQYGNPNDNVGLQGDRSVPQCIVLDMSDDSSPIPRKYTKRDILGRWNEDNERYLGSRMLDHVNYDVFELEWMDMDTSQDQRRLPLIMQSAKYPGLKPSENKRLFLTYYARSVPTSKQSDAIAAAGQENAEADQTEDVEIPLLSFVEVWEFDTVKKERRLINRVKFLEFSWDLDVEPLDDPMSQKSGPVDARVFDIEPCHQDRASQAELVIKFIRKAKENATQLDKLKDSQYIMSHAHSLFAFATGIHVLNLADTRAKILGSGDVLATTRVVELRSGISTKYELGLISYKPGDLANNIVKIVLNRHSLDECRLESISVPSTDVFAYCPNMAACLILKGGEEMETKLRTEAEIAEEQEQSNSQDNVNSDICDVESLTYKTVDVIKRDHTILERAFNFFQKSKIESSARHFWMGSAKYPYLAIAYKQLDSLGTRLNNDVGLLYNLRYSTKEEDLSSDDLITHVTAKTKMGALRFCQLACQMDDFCGSFSMCSSPTRDGMEQADCFLSSVRLTGALLNTIMAASVASPRGKEFSVSTVDLKESGVVGLVLVPDPLCSIHPKDFLADYHINHIARYPKKNPVSQTDVRAKQPKADKRRLDLEDCAGLKYEVNLRNGNPGNATFWYCPLDSHCIVGDDEVFSPDELTEHCYIYKRYPTRPYIRQPMTHLAAIKLDPSSTGQQHAITAQQKLDLLEKYAKSGTKQLASMIWTESEERCANDCNRHKSKCLAFDSCRVGDRVLCIMHSRRSLAMKESARFPLLEQERDNSAKFSVELQESDMCDHFYLRDDYFEVRLHAMLEDERKGFAADLNDKKQQEVKELDEKIDLEEKRQSDEIVDSLIEDAKQIVEIEAENERRGPSGNQLIHLMSLIFGLVVGAVGILYRQQISEGVKRVHTIYRERRARSNSINDPVLTNQDI